MIAPRALVRRMRWLCVFALFGVQPNGLAAQNLDGEFVADSAAGDDILAAIRAGTAGMNFIKRPIARKRLRNTNPSIRALSIHVTADSTRVVADDIVLRAVPDGQPMDWRGFRGEALRVSTTLAAGVLTHTFVADDGTRTSTYRMRDADVLELHVRLESPHLKRPIEYVRVFRRVNGAD